MINISKKFLTFVLRSSLTHRIETPYSVYSGPRLFQDGLLKHIGLEKKEEKKSKVFQEYIMANNLLNNSQCT